MFEHAGRYYIDGAWVTPHSKRVMAVTNPATQARITDVVLADEVDLGRAVAAAGRAFATFGVESKRRRLERLEALRAQTQRRMEDLAQAMMLEMGAPISMSRGMQADAAIGHLDAFIDALRAQAEREWLANGDEVHREPIGVCGLITPWNWPINQIALKVIPALATGCTCVLKPSEFTPLSATLYAEIIDAAGYPPGVFNLIHGEGSVIGDGLARHPEIDMVSFTGSTQAGTSVMRAAAASIKRVTLELGGKSPALVFADSDVTARVRAVVDNCFCNTGQSCDAPTRLLVERACYDEAVEAARQAAMATRVDDPAVEGDHLGPLYDEIQFARVQRYIQAGIDEGARLVAGGTGRPDGVTRGWFVKPTVFADVDNAMSIAREEIFGPVIVLIPFETEAEAIKLANDTPYGLAAYVECGDLERARRVARQLRAGAVYLNGGGYHYGSPFGGYRQSGNGREGGVYGLEEYQELKSLHVP